MAEFWATRKGDSLVPDGAESFAAFSKIPFGKTVKVEAKQPRNSGHHRLFWALCARIGDAVGASSENVCDLLKIETGHCDIVRSKKYGEIRLPRSISFAKMDQTEFRVFFERCVIVICDTWGMDRRDVLAAVEDLLIPQAQHAA